MNERIKELRRQATLVETYTANDGTVAEGKSVDLDKFAELIVHQMLEITDAHTEVFQTDRDRAVIEHIKQSVKQHFGVEE